ncbi:MAG: MarR family transcriptional regulator [Parvularculaceae bacterium]|nr:MarR family transcriptional regulator [Parvularculaceae bacterium]
MAVEKKSRLRSGPSDAGFDLEEYLPYNLIRTAAAYSEEMAKELKRFRLDTMKWRVLMQLHDKSPSSVGEIARRTVTKLPTLTRVLNRLEQEGMIVRQAREGDKRVIQVTMTPKASRALKQVQEIGQRVFERVIEGVDEREIALTISVMKQIRANLARSPYEEVEQAPADMKAKAS